MKARARVRVFGMVQGVLFRHYTAAMAKRLGVSGYVRNLEDGSVEALYEGEKGAVDEMVEWTKKGPPHARVTSFRFTWEEPTDEFSDFSVRY
ncbi:MAG TPA: acylphosphatase [Thermoproteota archaeon]|nr:acylphosphatase [Thermoproteota archaeon]